MTDDLEWPTTPAPPPRVVKTPRPWVEDRPSSSQMRAAKAVELADEEESDE